MAERLFKYLVFMLRIRRIEFRIAEIPILAIPILLMIRDTSILYTFPFWEGVFIFFLLFAFGDMINCLADRDLDAVYKPHLSESVYGLGVGFVTFQVIASALLAVVLSIHLSVTLNRWPIAAMTVIGVLLGAAYSVKPVQLKGRGLLQLLCLWVIIFVGPVMFVSQLISAEMSIPVLVFTAFYGMLQMGIILINTAEDYSEDLASGIRTTIVTLGLHRGIMLAFYSAAVGSIGSLAALAWFYTGKVSLPVWIVGLFPAFAACVFVNVGIWRLHRSISTQDLNESLILVKKAAKLVPVWVTVVAWSMLWSSYLFFYWR
ncbi:MAG: UbiA family prenyltransferase [Pyrinomonadaceae bacterium]